MNAEGTQAVYLALSLARTPSLASAMRKQALPTDAATLIRIASGCTDTLHAVAVRSGQPATDVRDAAVLYVQEILFRDVHDYYRILGANREAPASELKENFRNLMKWLHPDYSQNSWDSVFVGRVLAAWKVLGTPSGRAEYDRHACKSLPARGSQLPRAAVKGRRTAPALRRIPVPRNGTSREDRVRRWFRPVVGLLTGLVISVGLVLLFTT